MGSRFTLTTPVNVIAEIFDLDELQEEFVLR